MLPKRGRYGSQKPPVPKYTLVWTLSGNGLVVPQKLLQALLCLANDSEEKIRIALASKLRLIGMQRLFTEGQLTEIITLGLTRLNDVKDAVVSSYLLLLQDLPVPALLNDHFWLLKYYERRRSLFSSPYWFINSSDGHSWREFMLFLGGGASKSSGRSSTNGSDGPSIDHGAPVATTSSPLFQRQHFSHILNYISRGSRDDEEAGLLRMMFCCDALPGITTHPNLQQQQKEEKGEESQEGVTCFARFVILCYCSDLYRFLRDSSANLRSISEFWALLESSKFCVNSKLRTAFGGPKQTFEVIQRMVVMASSFGEMERQEAQMERPKRELTAKDFEVKASYGSPLIMYPGPNEANYDTFTVAIYRLV